MFMATVMLKQKDTGMMKEAPIGISITTVLFGCFVPLFRGDIKGALIGSVFGCMLWLPGNIIFSIIYNKMYIKDLLMKGFVPADDMAKNMLMLKGIHFSQN